MRSAHVCASMCMLMYTYVILIYTYTGVSQGAKDAICVCMYGRGSVCVC